MSTGLLQRNQSSTDALLSDQMYRGRTCDGPANARRPAPPTTMERTEIFRVRFGEYLLEFKEKPDDCLLPILYEICDLGFLQPNWDSYDAKSIAPEAAASAMGALTDLLTEGDPLPSVVPTSRGGILLEWHEGGIDLEVDVQSPSSIHVSFEDGGHEEECVCVDLGGVRRKLTVLRNRLEKATENG